MNILWIGLLVLSVGVIFFMVGVNLTENKVIYENIEVEKQQPMILVELLEWGENINDNEELIFSYYLYNFGDTEAKNITVSCELSLDSEQEHIVWEEDYNLGNLGSNSNKYYESYMKYYSDSKGYYGSCELKSIDGDYINLKDRI